MGRQFSYYAFPEDLAEIEDRVFKPLGGSLLSEVVLEGERQLEAIDSFPLALEQMGRQTIHLLLSPPKDIEHIVVSDGWVRKSESHLIEVGRSYIQDGKIGIARFWYETRLLRDGGFVAKPKEFTDWAEEVFRRTKRLLTRHSVGEANHAYTEWYGKTAKREVEEGRVVPRQHGA